MAYIIDIILLVIFVVVVISSTKKGFFKSLFDLIGTFLSVLLARIFSESYAAVFFENFISGTARTTLENNLGSVGTTDYGAQVEQAVSSIPDSFNGIMEMIGINKQALLDQISSSEFSEGTLIDHLMNNIVTPVGTAVTQFIMFVLFTVVLIIAIKFIVKVLNFLIKRIPVVKSLNKSLGVVIGILRGFIAVVIIAVLFGMVATLSGNSGFSELVNSSYIVSAAEDIFASVSGATIN